MASSTKPAPTPAPSSNKVMDLGQAIRQLITPGSTVHLGAIHSMPYAASYELARAFAGTDARFEIITQGAVLNTLTLIHLGLVRRLVTSYSGDVYPTPGPTPIIQRAVHKNGLEIEDWSLLSLTHRLMAGALGVPFLPSNGPRGTDMAVRNHHSYAELEHPFGPDKQPVVKALNPDISLYHVWAADPDGNAICTGPRAEAVWGAMAAKQGAVITAERIVRTEEIRELADLGLLPGRYVKAVCPAPFGAHPSGMSSHGYPGANGYTEDYRFVVEFQQAATNPKDLTDWIRKWILKPKDHNEYLARLGADRLHRVRGRAAKDAWQYDLKKLQPDGPSEQPAGHLEAMTLAASHMIQRAMKDHDLDTILAGIGSANLAAWMAHHALRTRGKPVYLVAEVGFVGYTPRPADPFIFNFSNIPTCTARLDVAVTLGVLVGGSQSRCVGALGAGQVDRLGNINSTDIPGVMRLVGSGGAADVANGARTLVVVAPLSPMRLVEKLPYVTAPGDRVCAVVTHRCVLEKDETGELVLTRLLPHPGLSEAQAVEKIREKCGWKLKVADRFKPVPEPTAEELALLRSFDPRKAFIGEPEN